MNHLTMQQIQALAFAGASLTIEANRYKSSDIQSLAMIVKNKRNRLVIQKSDSLSSQQMLAIAFAGSGHVHFEP